MGHRISKVVTKTGDDGTTGLGDGSRRSKTDHRLMAIGDVDELNSVIGLALVKVSTLTPGRNLLRLIQHRLFDLGAELSVPGLEIIDEKDVALVENDIELLNEMLEPLKNFIIPGGSEATARLHQARAVCRRAERSVWALYEVEEVNEHALKYLNRLSDYLFVMARHEGNGNQILWQAKEKH